MATTERLDTVELSLTTDTLKRHAKLQESLKAHDNTLKCVEEITKIQQYLKKASGGEKANLEKHVGKYTAAINTLEKATEEYISILREHCDAISQVDKLNSTHKELTTAHTNSDEDTRNFLGVDSLAPTFSTEDILKFRSLKESKLPEEGRKKTAKCIAVFLGTLSPSMLVAGLAFRSHWSDKDDTAKKDLFEDVVRRLGNMRRKDRDHYEIWNTFLDVARVGNGLLQAAPSDQSNITTPSSQGNPKNKERGDIKKDMANKGIKFRGAETMTESYLLDLIGRAWSLGDQLQHFVDRYSEGFLRTFPFEHFRNIVGGKKTESNFSPAILGAVFEAIKTAPELDKFFQELCDAVRRAESPDALHSWLCQYHQSHKASHRLLLAKPEELNGSPKLWYTDLNIMMFGVYTHSTSSPTAIPLNHLAIFHPWSTEGERKQLFGGSEGEGNNVQCIMQILTTLVREPPSTIGQGPHPKYYIRGGSLLKNGLFDDWNDIKQKPRDYLITYLLGAPVSSTPQNAILLRCRVHVVDGQLSCHTWVYNPDRTFQVALKRDPSQSTRISKAQGELSEAVGNWLDAYVAKLGPAFGITRKPGMTYDSLEFVTYPNIPHENHNDLSIVLDALSLVWHGQPWKTPLHDDEACNTLRRALLTRFAQIRLRKSFINQPQPTSSAPSPWEKNPDLLFLNH